MFGTCITPDFMPTNEENTQLNVPYYRSILYQLSDLDKLKRLNKPLVITLNNQCKEVGSNWAGWDSSVLYIAQTLQHQCKMFGAGNEFDLYWHANKQDCTPEFAASLAIRASRICHQYGIKVAPTSVAGPEWPEYIDHLVRLCKNDVDYFDVHPYGKKPNGWKDGEQWMFGQADEMVNHVSQLSGKPTIMSEYGVKIKDAGSEQEVANFLKAANDTFYDMPVRCWFAYSDAIGTSSEQGDQAFGMKAADGRYRPAWSTMMEINKGRQLPPDPLDEWKVSVGDGLLDMMRADGTEPIMASEWRPFDRPEGTAATVEQCIAKNGDTYMWLLPTNTGYVIRAELKAKPIS